MNFTVADVALPSVQPTPCPCGAGTALHAGGETTEIWKAPFG